MSAAPPMAKEKPGSSQSDGTEEKKNLKVTVKLHKRLKRIAHELDVDMGDLVERELEDFLNREEEALRQRLGGQ